MDRDRLAIITAKGTSLMVVAEDIKYVAERNNIDAEIIKRLVPITYVGRNFDRAVMFVPFDPHYVLSYVAYYHSLRRYHFPVKFYTTIEGIPDRYLVPDWMARVLRPIANSRFTESCLRAAGLDVADVIPHGLNLELFASINSQKDFDRDYVLFGTIGFNHPRKGLRFLKEIVEACERKAPQARFIVVSTPDGNEMFRDHPNVIATYPFGELPRKEVLGLIASLDFYLLTSMAEGFGLPVLEAQALGTPCIHASYDPINEISHKDNLRARVVRVERQKFSEGLYNLMHYYDVDEMIELVSYACDLKLNRRDEYLDLSRKVMEFAWQFDALKFYKPLVM